MTTSASAYVPELGQAAFGAPWLEFTMPRFVEAGLRVLGAALADESSSGGDPCGNTGAIFENDVFAMRAYCWCDGDAHPDGCPANFEHKASGFEASWYKYLGRGGSMSGPIDVGRFEVLLEECHASLAGSGMKAARTGLETGLLEVLPTGAYVSAALEGPRASLQIWLPWPAGVDAAPDMDAVERVCAYVEAARTQAGEWLAGHGWAVMPEETSEEPYFLTMPLPPVGDGSREDAMARTCYRELSDAELRAAGYDHPSDAFWSERFELTAYSGINLFVSASALEGFASTS